MDMKASVQSVIITVQFGFHIPCTIFSLETLCILNAKKEEKGIQA
jgi:hypothetical protein